ncbi:hypothetical protein BG011_004971 [Mortierella polycephala]|uniref:Uncharacterized protein n=1 Tax=Mortierella polycephala TaxID=41804 RepID=A0A9P6Q096_9FUNG|nr:hypothetical protein BG011_004971 [Mortierella polycephala]
MTTLQSYSQSNLFGSSSSSSHSLSPSSTSTSELLILEDYQTVSALDLFHSPEVDFKNGRRQRAYAASQKNHEQSKRNYFQRKINKAQQQQQGKQKQIAKKSSQEAGLSSSSDSERCKDNIVHATTAALAGTTDRSNKRADRRRRPQDEVLDVQDSNSLETEENEDEGYSSYNSARSCSSDDETEERIRFQRNLNFKTDDDGVMVSKRIGARQWKQTFVQKLNEQDQAREQKRTEKQRERSRPRC